MANYGKTARTGLKGLGSAANAVTRATTAPGKAFISALRGLPKATQGFGTSPQAGQGFLSGALKTVGGMNLPVVSPAASAASAVVGGKPAPRLSTAAQNAQLSHLTPSADKVAPGKTKGTTSLAGTPTSTPESSTMGGTEQMSPSYDKESAARQYLQDENAASLAMGSKNLVQQMRGKTPTAPTDTTMRTAAMLDKPAAAPRQAPSVIDQLRSRVGSLSAPSASEAALQDELAQFRGDAAMGIAGLEGQGRGIPLSLIRGQQAKLGEQAALQEQTLLDRIAAQAAQRQAQLTAAQTELGYATQDQARQDALTAPQQVGNSIIRFNPASNTYDTLYTAPQEATAADQPALVQEYEYAKNNGYTGSFLDYQTAKNMASGSSGSGDAYTLSPGQVRYDASGNVIASVPKGTSDSLNTTQQADLVNISTAEQTIDTLLSMAGTGNIPGLGLWQGRLPAATLSAQGQQARAMLGTIRSQVAKANAGTSFTENEQKLLEESLPTPTDSDSVLLTKLNTLKTMLSNKRDAIYQVSGGSPAGGTQTNPYQSLLDSGQITPDEFYELSREGGFTNAPSTAVKGSIVDIKLGDKTLQVSDQIAGRLAAADSEYFRATGKHIVVSEGLRSHDRQAQLYQAYKTGKGGRAAPPGQSFHETGNAIDVSGDWKAAEPYLRKYGFLNNLADDKHHFSYLEFS